MPAGSDLTITLKKVQTAGRALFPTEGFKAALFLEFPLFPITEFRGSCRNIHRYRVGVTF